MCSRKTEIDRKRDKTNLGHLSDLRRLRKMLDISSDDETVRLLYESSDSINVEELALFPESYASTVKIEKKYLESAKVHITTENFDLAYVEMIIALESAIKAYVARQSKSPVNLESIVKDLSLMDLVTFGIVFLGKKSIDDETFKSLNRAYNIRNTIVHNKARKFKVSEVIESIRVVEKFVEMMERLP